MRWLYLCLLLLVGCGDDGGPDTPPLRPAVFELIEEGTGGANAETLWHLNVGSYIVGSYSVESKHGPIYRVLKLENPRAFVDPRPHIVDVQRWTKSEHGLALVSSIVDGERSAPLVVVPPSVRNGMSWRTSDGFVATVVSAGVQDTDRGQRAIWNIDLVQEDDGLTLNFIFAEGAGPYRASSALEGVIVLDDDSSAADTFTLPNAATPTLFDSAMPRVSPGIYSLGALDVEGAPYIFTAHANYLAIGAQSFDFRNHDHCYLVGPSGELSFLREDIAGRGPHVGACPIYFSPLDEHTRLVSSPALATPSGAGAMLWFGDKTDPDGNGTANTAYSLPHYVDGELRAFVRGQLGVNSVIDLETIPGDLVTSEIFETYRTTHTGTYDEAEGHLRIGLDFDSESGQLRYITTAEQWVTANSIVGSQPGVTGESWFLPGRNSVRTHDAGREVFLTRPDGVVLAIDTDGREIYTSLAAHAGPLADGPYTGAVRHPSGIVLSVNVPESLVTTIPFVKVPPVESELTLSSSFAFRATRHGFANGFVVCYPKRYAALADLNLRAMGSDAAAIYPSDFADGCGLVLFDIELPLGTAIEATLPGIGSISALTNDTINVVGSSDSKTIPLRGGGFASPRMTMDDAGVVTEVSEVPRNSIGDGRRRLRDLGGHGYWIFTADENGYLSTVRLSNVSGVTWPVLPFRAQTPTVSPLIKSIRTDGVIYVCDTLPTDEPGCFSVDKSGVLTSVPYTETVAAHVVLDDGTNCYANASSKKVWCGQVAQPLDALSVPGVGAGIPQGKGFYMQTILGTHYYDADTNTLSLLTNRYDAIYVLDDNLVVGVYEGWLLRLNGTTETVVFSQATLTGAAALADMLPGRNTVLIAGIPYAYDPTAN